MLWGDLFHHTRIPAHSLRNMWKTAFCFSRWCEGLGCHVKRKQMGETFCLFCAVLARSRHGINLGSDALLQRSQTIGGLWQCHYWLPALLLAHASSAGLSVPGSLVCKTRRDRCLENQSLLKIVLCCLNQWGCEVCASFPHGSGWLPLKAAGFAAVSRVACSVRRHLLCWAPAGMRHWNRGLCLGCGKTAVWGPAVCLGNTFPSYSFGWNLVLENASLK